MNRLQSVQKATPPVWLLVLDVQTT